METVQEKLESVEKTIEQQKELLQRLTVETNKVQQQLVFLHGQKQAFEEILSDVDKNKEPVECEAETEFVKT